MLYLDTSFVAPLLLEESTSSKVEALLRRCQAGELAVSQWTCVEFSSLIAREVRMGGLTQADAGLVIAEFDELIADSFQVVLPTVADYQLAIRYIQQFDTKLRSGDALHLAIARNHGAATLYSLDRGLLDAAKRLKVRASRGIRD